MCSLLMCTNRKIVDVHLICFGTLIGLIVLCTHSTYYTFHSPRSTGKLANSDAVLFYLCRSCVHRPFVGDIFVGYLSVIQVCCSKIERCRLYVHCYCVYLCTTWCCCDLLLLKMVVQEKKKITFLRFLSRLLYFVQCGRC